MAEYQSRSRQSRCSWYIRRLVIHHIRLTYECCRSSRQARLQDVSYCAFRPLECSEQQRIQRHEWWANEHVQEPIHINTEHIVCLLVSLLFFTFAFWSCLSLSSTIGLFDFKCITNTVTSWPPGTLITQRKIGRENLVMGTAAPSIDNKDSLGKSEIDSLWRLGTSIRKNVWLEILNTYTSYWETKATLGPKINHEN